MKELHIWLCEPQSEKLITTLRATQDAINAGVDIIHTAQPHVCNTESLEQGYRIFAHMLDGAVVEIKLGYIDGCSKQIRREHNLEKMLLAGCFGRAM